MLKYGKLDSDTSPLVADNNNGGVFLKVGNDGKIFFNMPELPNVPTRGVPYNRIPGIKVAKSIKDAIAATTRMAALVAEALEKRLPTTALMDALCVVTPRFWIGYVGAQKHIQSVIEKEFISHMQLLIKQFGVDKLNVDGEDADALVDGNTLLLQAAEFLKFMVSQTEALVKTQRSSSSHSIALTSMSMLPVKRWRFSGAKLLTRSMLNLSLRLAGARVGQVLGKSSGA